MKKILVISNSFGVDATRYLYGIARAAKEDVRVATLYIGGCSLYRHYRNMFSEEKAYEYYINGIRSGLRVSLKEALLLDEWDVVTMQQCSMQSGVYESYFPYLPELSAYVKKLAPAAKQYVHMTWGYSDNSKLLEGSPYENRDEMVFCIRRAYKRAAEYIGADGIIPSLDAMCKLYDEIGDDTYRDGYHASLGIGRYTLACVWFMTLFGKDIEENSFCDFDTDVNDDEILLARDIAREAVIENGVELDRE